MKLSTLIKSAQRTTKALGHRMIWTKYSEKSAVATCRDCGEYVTCLTNPLPNQIDIGGSAVAIDCVKR